MVDWRSTGYERKTDAEHFVINKLKEWEPPARAPSGRTLRDFLSQYYVWDACPRIAERRANGKRIDKQHAERQRRLIEKYILTDLIAEMNVRKMTRGDVKDFKNRLVKKYGTTRRVNSIITVLKTCFRDGVDRELLKRDPAAGIGKVSYKKAESGIFTAKELQKLFPWDSIGPWEDLQDYTSFLIAATCGIKRGEILALQWRDIDFNNQVLVNGKGISPPTGKYFPPYGGKEKCPVLGNRNSPPLCFVCCPSEFHG
jgi:integrase